MRNRSNKPIITEQDLDKVFNLGVHLGSFDKAIKELIKAGEIKEYCTGVYYSRIKKRSTYKQIILRKKAIKKNNEKLAFILNKKGRNYSQIAKILKIPRIQAFYLVNSEKREEYKTTIRETKNTRTKKEARKLVNYWNEYNIENRFPTDETIQAFELLNLTPPERL